MENIKFIKRITDDISMGRTIIGNCIYYDLANGNIAKIWCEELGVEINIINSTHGKVDNVYLPFANYFEAVQCSSNSPKWHQHIDKGHWYFEESYKHVLPKNSDYMRLAKAIETYINMF